MAKSEFAHYIEEVLRLKAKYAGRSKSCSASNRTSSPNIRALYRDIYAKYPFDYIIGSVHHRGTSASLTRTAGRSWTKRSVARSNITALFRAPPVRPVPGARPYRRDEGLLSGILRHCARKPTSTLRSGGGGAKIPLEINTSGSTKDFGGWYPSDAIFERACTSVPRHVRL